MDKPDIKKMVDRFLGWPLPKTFAPDCGISFKPLDHPNGWPIGTNLFTAVEAKEMFEYVLQQPADKPEPSKYVTGFSIEDGRYTAYGTELGDLPDGTYHVMTAPILSAQSSDKPEGKAEQQNNGKMPPPEDWGNVSKEELARRELEYLKKIAKAEQQAEPVFVPMTTSGAGVEVRFSANLPAQPQQLTDEAVTPERLADCIPQTATFSAVDNYVRMTYQELRQFARALLAAQGGKA